jgi:hypothetical protein
MGTLSTLKLTAATKPQQVSPVQQRRNKLVRRIDEQIELASALLQGKHFSAVKVRNITDKETGLRRAVESSKRVKAWWFKQDNGKLALSVRYGAKVLELAKGKFAVEVAVEKELVTTLEVVNLIRPLKTPQASCEMGSASEALSRMDSAQHLRDSLCHCVCRKRLPRQTHC